MKSAALLRIEIRELQSAPMQGRPEVKKVIDAKVARKRAALVTAERRELKQLASLLNYKADIYYAGRGRLYVSDHKFTTQDGKLFYGKAEIDPSQLYDGHGHAIVPPEAPFTVH